MKENGKLYIVPTPIGNMEDITLRAIKVLAEVDKIACEDTRRTGMLLKHHSISAKKLESYHEHNEKEKASILIKYLQEGKSIAVASDAGTPGISDPAYRLVVKCVENAIDVVSLPGASSTITALVASGLPTDQFRFFGFPPQKKGRQTFLQNLANSDCTSIIFESPYKIEKIIDELIKYCGVQRRICFARELTKVFEEYIRGTLIECKEALKSKSSIKGEFVIILEGKKNEKL